MFGNLLKKAQKKNNTSNIEKVQNIEEIEESQNDSSENNNADVIESNSEDQDNEAHEQYIIEEEEEPSMSDHSTLVIPNRYSKLSDIHGGMNGHNISQLKSSTFIDSLELSQLKTEIQNRFDIHPNVKLPVAVEYSLGAISDRTDIGCKTIHSNIEELSALTDEIIQKSNECNHLISRLNEYTVKVSKELRITKQSIQQIRVPRRSLLQFLMLFLFWIFDLFTRIYHRIETRNRSTST